MLRTQLNKYFGVQDYAIKPEMFVGFSKLKVLELMANTLPPGSLSALAAQTQLTQLELCCPKRRPLSCVLPQVSEGATAVYT